MIKTSGGLPLFIKLWVAAFVVTLAVFFAQSAGLINLATTDAT